MAFCLLFFGEVIVTNALRKGIDKLSGGNLPELESLIPVKIKDVTGRKRSADENTDFNLK